MQLNDTWLGLEGDNDGQPYLIRARENIIVFRTQGQHQVRIDICYNYIGDLDSGMPGATEIELLEEIENALVEELEYDIFAILAIVYTGNKQRVWYWYSKDADVAISRINHALSKFVMNLPLDIYSCVDPDWKIYCDILD